MNMRVMEPQSSWGGDWTEAKLNAFEKYVNAYLKIMHAQRSKYNSWPENIIYFDGFAGSGYRFKSSQTGVSNSLFKELDAKDEGVKVYCGSAERVVKMEKKFDEYFFVDTDSASLNSLKERLRPYFSPDCKYNFIAKDVNEALKDFSDDLTNQDVALVFLDPFGMQIKWESIKHLQGKKVDLWILIPTGVAINRLLDRKGKLKNIKVIEIFFGLKEDEIRSHFYKKNTINTLFGEDEETKKIKDSAKEAALLYCERLTTIWKFVTEEPLVLLNEQKVPIYHLVFASNNETAIKIAKYIIGRE